MKKVLQGTGVVLGAGLITLTLAGCFVQVRKKEVSNEPGRIQGLCQADD